MDLLARREHSQTELLQKLSRRFPDRDAVAEAVDRLAEEGLQSDERFALSFTRERILRGQGPARIFQDLRQRGVASTFADQALRVVVQDERQTWHGLAEAALTKRYGSAELSGLDPEERVRRLRFLYRRGFDTEAFGPILD